MALCKSTGDRLIPVSEGSWDVMMDGLTDFYCSRAERFGGPYDEEARAKMKADMRVSIGDPTLFNMFQYGIYTFVILPKTIEMSKFRFWT